MSQGNGKGKPRVKQPQAPKETEIIHLPKHADKGIPLNLARKVRKEFKEWKRQFINMINHDSQIEWYQDAAGQIAYRFILSANLCEVVYEIQIRERIRAQTEHALQKLREQGGTMPDTETIEKAALANLQQEFMAHSLATMRALFAEQKLAGKSKADQAAIAAEAAKPTVEADEPTSEEEAEAASKLQQLRAELIQGDLAGKVETAEEHIKAELDRRKE